MQIDWWSFAAMLLGAIIAVLMGSGMLFTRKRQPILIVGGGFLLLLAIMRVLIA